MDLIAGELNMDPSSCAAGFPKPDEFPFATATGAVLRQRRLRRALSKALEIVDYKKLREEQKAAQARGD